MSEVEGLGLIEATYLVLISGVTPPLADAGLQVKDTIMSMSVAGTQFHESTKAMDLAFEIADRSDGEGFTTKCTRIFIFGGIHDHSTNIPIRESWGCIGVSCACQRSEVTS